MPRRRAFAASLSLVAALLLVAAGAQAQERPPPPPPAEAPQDDEVAPPPATRPPMAPAPGPAAPPAPAPDAPRPDPAAPQPGDTLPGDGEEATEARAAEDAAADTIYQTLRRLDGFTVMEYRGESATFHTEERVLRLFGPAEVTREGDRLTAEDTIVYRERTQLVEAYGQPTMSGQAETIEGNVMFYDLATRRATVRGGRTQVAEAGASWFVRGDVTAEGTDRLYASRSTFTTDDRDDPAYYFESDDIKVIRDRILVGRPARLYFRNVPVFWLPFVAQDLTRGRRSGLLAPEFSINDIVRNRSSPAGGSGTGRQISNLGFYWAINDYMDAQVSGAWRSGDYTALRGAAQYNWQRQFLQGNAAFTRYWQDVGSRQFTLYTNNSWRPSERTNMSLNANYSTSTQFLRESTTDYFQATQNIASSFRLNRRFDWGALDMGASRQQSMANDQVSMELPQVGLTINPITLFREPSPAAQSWYSNATLSLGGSLRRNTKSHGPDAPPRLRDEAQTQVQARQSFTVGGFSLGSNFNLNRLEQPAVPAREDFPFQPRVGQDRGQWQSNLSYRIGLIGETHLSPNLGLSQEIRAGTFDRGPVIDPPFWGEPIVTDGYVTGPLRSNFGAGLNTALYGFLPGFGTFSALRHKITPSLSYSYVPEVDLTPEQERIFGRTGGRMQNNLTLSFSQTFEAKLREDRPANGAAAPGVAGDAEPGEAGDAPAPGLPGAQAAPPQDRKVTLLSINTSAFNYDFARDTLGQRVGFTTHQVTNTINSDYLRGLSITMTHDLFDPSDVPLEQRGTELGRFSPRLSGLNTRFTLGEGTALLRWLGLTGRVREAPESTDSIPARPLPSAPVDPTRSGGFTQNPQAAGRGPWRMDVGYTLRRPRDGGTRVHDLQLGTSFAPTPNWAVNWYTNYSIEDGEFGGHRITLRRDLYRWEANFNFSRTPYGNTSFDVLIRLKDLPDLKVDYREHNIGAIGRR